MSTIFFFIVDKMVVVPGQEGKKRKERRGKARQGKKRRGRGKEGEGEGKGLALWLVTRLPV